MCRNPRGLLLDPGVVWSPGSESRPTREDPRGSVFSNNDQFTSITDPSLGLFTLSLQSYPFPGRPPEYLIRVKHELSSRIIIVEARIWESSTDRPKRAYVCSRIRVCVECGRHPSRSGCCRTVRNVAGGRLVSFRGQCPLECCARVRRHY